MAKYTSLEVIIRPAIKIINKHDANAVYWFKPQTTLQAMVSS